MDATLLPLSRKAWSDLETLHVLGYFAPEVTAAYVELGLHPRLSYFPARAAAFGEAGPGLTVATFYVFAPWLVEAALPAAWETASPASLVAARRSGMALALEKAVGRPDVGEALEIARAVCAGLTPQGRPLYAAHADLPWPDDDLLALWHAATLIREHRGDGHLSVLQHAGIDPVEATVLGGMYSSSTPFLRKTRGWSEEEYAAATDRLRERGLARRGRRLHRRGPGAAPARRGRHRPARGRGLGAGRGRARPGGCTTWCRRCAGPWWTPACCRSARPARRSSYRPTGRTVSAGQKPHPLVSRAGGS